MHLKGEQNYLSCGKSWNDTLNHKELKETLLLSLFTNWLQKCENLSLRYAAAAAAAKLLQSCPTLCDPIDGSPPGSAVPGVLQARTREWVSIRYK